MNGRFYVIGDRETGVIFMKTDPLRVALVSKESIEQYAKQYNVSVQEAFALVARGAKHRIFRARVTGEMPSDAVIDSFADLVRQGTSVTNAEFCYIADVQNTDWSTDRYRSTPISGAVVAVAPGTPSPTDQPVDVVLVNT